MSSKATFTEVRLGIMGGYIHAVTWQIVDTRQVALLLIYIVSHRFYLNIIEMKKQEIPEWEGITDYRPPVFKDYEFNFNVSEHYSEPEKTSIEQLTDIAALNYAREIVGDPSNDLWLERRKLTDAFKMGIEFAKRHLNGG